MNQHSRKSAIITGGAKRIGKQIAVELAKNGYDIALHFNRSGEDAQQVKTEIEKLGGNCNLFKADFNIQGEVNKLIPRIFALMPDCQLLINNASIYQQGSFLESDMTFLKHQFQINFEAPYQLSRDFAKKRSDGHIINIIDTKVTQLNVDYFCYSLSKKTLYEFTRMAAKELAPSIRVNGICPGLILSPVNEGDEYLEKMSKTIPLKRAGNPDLITRTVMFLINNTFITGECIHVDGGEHLNF